MWQKEGVPNGNALFLLQKKYMGEKKCCLFLLSTEKKSIYLQPNEDTLETC